MPTNHWAVIKGGHNIKGKAIADVDLNEAREALTGFRGKVDSIAVSGYLSIRNPEHELLLRDLARQLLDIPVVCAHELSTSLGFYERTVTAVLYARLIPVIATLLRSVKEVLIEQGIRAPLMIVKGDGSLMSEEVAMEKPIETILSGPAASLMGAGSLAMEPAALVVDMGGTTTDIALLYDGFPWVNREGATVGGWKTWVQAADISTFGLGDDSYLWITKDRQLLVGPQRVIPLALAAFQYPYLLSELEEMFYYRKDMLFDQPTDCFMKRDQVDPNLVNFDHLVQLGALTRISLTPTDLLHVKGDFTAWNSEASRLGTEILAERMEMKLDDFINMTLDTIIEKLCEIMIQGVISFEGSSLWLEDSSGAMLFVNRILKPQKAHIFELQAQLKYPIIGIGAPVNAYLPKAAKKLNAPLVIPDDAEVANAVGAAIGKVVEKIRILIRPDKEGTFIVHTPKECKLYGTLQEAKEFALKQAGELAAQAAEKAGAADYQLLVSHKDIHGSTGPHLTSDLFIETVVEAMAIGSPKWGGKLA